MFSLLYKNDIFMCEDRNRFFTCEDIDGVSANRKKDLVF